MKPYYFFTSFFCINFLLITISLFLNLKVSSIFFTKCLRCYIRRSLNCFSFLYPSKKKKLQNSVSYSLCEYEESQKEAADLPTSQNLISRLVVRSSTHVWTTSGLARVITFPIFRILFSWILFQSYYFVIFSLDTSLELLFYYQNFVVSFSKLFTVISKIYSRFKNMSP